MDRLRSEKIGLVEKIMMLPGPVLCSLEKTPSAGEYPMEMASLADKDTVTTGLIIRVVEPKGGTSQQTDKSCQLVQQCELQQIPSGEQEDFENQLKVQLKVEKQDLKSQLVEAQQNDDQGFGIMDNGNELETLQQKIEQNSSALDIGNQLEKSLLEDDQGLVSFDNPCEGCQQCKCRQASIKPFMCAGCLVAFSSICKLHDHLEFSHTDSELYYFDKITQKAFPRYGTACKVTQTEMENIQNVTSNVFAQHTGVLAHADPGLGRVNKVDPDETAPAGAVSSESTLLASGSAKDVKNAPQLKPQKSSHRKRKKQKKSKEVVNVQDVASRDVEVINVLPEASIKTEPEIEETEMSGPAGDANATGMSESYVNGDVKEEDVEHESEILTEPIDNRSVPAVNLKTGAQMMDDESGSGDENLHNTLEEKVLPNTNKKEKVKKRKAVDSEKRTFKSRKKKAVDSKKKTIEKKIIQCEKCDKTFGNEYLLKRHSVSHDKPSTHLCDLCNKSFATKSSLKSHHAAFHSAEKNFVCQHCGLTFAMKLLLQAHIKKCLDIRPFPCPYENCSRAYRERGTLEKHIRKHTGEMPFVCEICGAGYKCISTLNVHKIVHTGERPNKCDQCLKTFTTRSRLNRHKQIHDKVTPCVCECGKAFTNNWNLKAHQRQHNDDRPYKCEVCGESFKHNVSKKNHMRVHSKLEIQYML